MTDTAETAETTAVEAVGFVLNGTPVEVRGRHPHLLSALREELGVTSPKDGCAPSGQCGCCTVLVDGKAVVSCNLALAKVAGKEVTTLEGFDATEVARYADTFAACGALQCGFCTPGIVVRTKSLVDRKGAGLTRDDAARHLGAHLCRCTGYVKILDAVEALAQGKTLQPERPGGVGSSGVKYEAVALAAGARPGRAHGRGQDRVHRRDHHRQDRDDRGGAIEPEAGESGTRREESERGVRRRGHRRGD